MVCSWPSSPDGLWEVFTQLFDHPFPGAVEVHLDLRQAPSGNLGNLVVAVLFESAQLERPAVRLAQAREDALQLLAKGAPGGLLLGGGRFRRHVGERGIVLSPWRACGDDQPRTPPPVDPQVVGGAQQIGAEVVPVERAAADRPDEGLLEEVFGVFAPSQAVLQEREHRRCVGLIRGPPESPVLLDGVGQRFRSSRSTPYPYT